MGRAQEIGWLLAHASTHDAIRRHQRSKNYQQGDHGAVAGSAAAAPSVTSGRPLKQSHSSPSIGLVSGKRPEGPPLAELLKVNTRSNPSMFRPRNFCPITKYADTYVATMHHDPF